MRPHTPNPDLPTLATALATARAAYDTALGSMVYTQASLDGVRTLRNTLELAAYNYAVAAGAAGLFYPTPVSIPVSYPGIAPPLVAPTDISGCVLWLTSDAGITVDGSNNVLAWADQSGAGNDAVWDLGKYAYLPNVFGSLPGLYNDVSAGTLKSAAASRLVAPGAARTVFIVAKPFFIDDGCIFLDMQPGRSTAAKSLSLGVYNKASGGTLYPASDLSSIDETLIAAPPSAFANVAQIFAYKWQGGGHNVNFAIAGESFNPLSGTALTTETGDNGYTIGHGYGAAHHGPMRGSIASAIVYDSQLSTDDYGRVCAWLAAKFAL